VNMHAPGCLCNTTPAQPAPSWRPPAPSPLPADAGASLAQAKPAPPAAEAPHTRLPRLSPWRQFEATGGIVRLTPSWLLPTPPLHKPVPWRAAAPAQPPPVQPAPLTQADAGAQQVEPFGGPSAGAEAAAAAAAIPATPAATAKDSRVIDKVMLLLLGLRDPVMTLINEGGDNVSEESLKQAVEEQNTIRATVSALLGHTFGDTLHESQAPKR